MAKISDVEIVDGARDFRLMKRYVVNAILEMNEYNRFSKGIFCWVGFKTKYLEYENIERAGGMTKWNFWKLFNLLRFIADSLYILLDLWLDFWNRWVGICYNGVFIIVVERYFAFGYWSYRNISFKSIS